MVICAKIKAALTSPLSQGMRTNHFGNIGFNHIGLITASTQLNWLNPKLRIWLENVVGFEPVSLTFYSGFSTPEILIISCTGVLAFLIVVAAIVFILMGEKVALVSLMSFSAFVLVSKYQLFR